ncbi:NAD(P)/FAD-dependent oxidoreductase [Sphingomonas flavalba]|uniref:FAD/NAD(P)-dependent oxidoreductase n=1 Tax=Sphingomonas flavalba TaxID=2559804 RepID=UPI00109DB40B|nr:(2Fe-2S)-binding protein [Sphingomonas flavalba]
MIDLAIIGGGPAGQAAAEQAAAAGLSVAVFDEQPRPGGQIARQPPAGFTVPDWLAGRAYAEVRAQLARFEGLGGVAWHGGTAVAGLAAGADGFRLTVVTPDGAERVAARRVLVAAGCYDLPVPLPGWTLPGVMSAGAAQAFVKSQRIVPGGRFVLAGTHPLMLVVAAQIVESGGVVAAVMFDQPLGRCVARALADPLTIVRHAGLFVDAAAARRVLARAGVPVRFGRPLAAVEGSEAVAAARFADGSIMACDRVALCYGFVPQADLPRQAGATVRWQAVAGGWATAHDAWMETDRPGLFVAGETTGVGGAAIALCEGRLAGIGIARSLGRLDDAAAAGLARATRRRHARLSGFARMLAAIADPAEVLARVPPADTILCRCEDVTHAEIDAVLATATAPNAVKLATRCGMGVCQGRMCEGALLRRIAAADGTAPGAAGGFTARFPARLVPIDLLCGLDDVSAEAVAD